MNRSGKTTVLLAIALIVALVGMLQLTEQAYAGPNTCNYFCNVLHNCTTPSCRCEALGNTYTTCYTCPDNTYCLPD